MLVSDVGDEMLLVTVKYRISVRTNIQNMLPKPKLLQRVETLPIAVLKQKIEDQHLILFFNQIGMS